VKLFVIDITPDLIYMEDSFSIYIGNRRVYYPETIVAIQKDMYTVFGNTTFLVDIASGGELLINLCNYGIGTPEVVVGKLNTFKCINSDVYDTNDLKHIKYLIKRLAICKSDKDEKYSATKTKLPKIINIDGLDGCGKTTTAKTLYDRLTSIGAKVHYVHFPNYDSPSGKLIKEYLDGNLFKESGTKLNPTLLAYLFVLDRYVYFINNMEMLKSCDHIICDRSYISTYIYQTLGASDHKTQEIKNMIIMYELTLLRKISDTMTNIMLTTSSVEANLRLLESRDSKKDLFEKDMEYLKSIYDYIRKLEGEFRDIVVPRGTRGIEKTVIDNRQRSNLFFTWARVEIDNYETGDIYSPNEIVDKIMSKYK